MNLLDKAEGIPGLQQLLLTGLAAFWAGWPAALDFLRSRASEASDPRRYIFLCLGDYLAPAADQPRRVGGAFNDRHIRGGHNGRELGHGTFLWGFECGAPWTAVTLYLPPKAELFFGLRGLGVAQPGRAQEGAQGGNAPAPANFAQLLGVGEGLWACQKGQIGQKIVRFGQVGAARSRQDELIERRPEEQGTQDAHKKQMRGCGYSLHGN
jgi:hypothetical protein